MFSLIKIFLNCVSMKRQIYECTIKITPRETRSHWLYVRRPNIAHLGWLDENLGIFPIWQPAELQFSNTLNILVKTQNKVSSWHEIPVASQVLSVQQYLWSLSPFICQSERHGNFMGVCSQSYWWSADSERPDRHRGLKGWQTNWNLWFCP